MPSLGTFWLGQASAALSGCTCCPVGSLGLTPTSVTPQLAWESDRAGQEECAVAKVHVLEEK